MPDTLTRAQYWRSNVLALAVLLSIWFVVSYVLGILLVEPLNEIHIGGFPLGFWIAQQGSIYVFVLLILVYALWMRRLDARLEPGPAPDDDRWDDGGPQRDEGEGW